MSQNLTPAPDTEGKHEVYGDKPGDHSQAA